MIIKKNFFFLFFGGGGVGGSGWGGLRVGVNKELKFLGNLKKKIGGSGGQGGCERNVGGRG